MWLQSKQEWPENVVTKSSTEIEAESKTEREIVNTTTSRPHADDFDNLLERCNSLRPRVESGSVDQEIHRQLQKSYKTSRSRNPRRGESRTRLVDPTSSRERKARTTLLKDESSTGSSTKRQQLGIVPRPNTREASCISSEQSRVYGDVSSTGSSRGTPWGSGPHNGGSSRKVLDSEIAKPCQAYPEQVQRV